MRRFASIAATLLTLTLISISFAQTSSTASVPNLIRYEGMLRESNGAAIASKTVGVTFAIYKQQEGGAPVWLETQNVTLDARGNYSVLLGSATATGLPSDLFSQEEQRWLGVQMQGQAEQPRVLLVSVPYAFRAHEAETLGGRPASAFALAQGGVSNETTSSGSSPSDGGPDEPPRFTLGHGNTGYIPVWLNPLTLGNSVMFQSSGNVGIGTTKPAATLDVNGSVNTAGSFQVAGAKVLSGNADTIRVGDQQSQVFFTPILNNNLTNCINNCGSLVIDVTTGQLGYYYLGSLDAVKAQQQKIQTLEQEIVDLEQRLCRLEAIVRPGDNRAPQ